MLNPKEYRLMRTEILTYRERVEWENSKCPNAFVKREAYSHESSDYFSEQIKKYQEDGFIIEVVNINTDIKEMSSGGKQFMHTAHLILYMPI